MIKNYSEYDYPLHSQTCVGYIVPPTTITQYNLPNNTIPNQNIYTNNYTNTSIPVNNIITTQQRNQSNTRIIPTTTTTTTRIMSYRPQTAIYTTPISQQIQSNTANVINHTNNVLPQYYNNTNNYPQNYISYNIPQNNSYYTCNICQKTILSKDKNDHSLCHKLEQEEKDRLQAQRMQDELLFDNMPQEQIEEQRNIEQQIRQQQQRRNNNNNSINIFGTNDNNLMNDFNISSDLGNFDNINTMNNISGSPNVIIRRIITSNGNSPNITGGMGNPDFFTNFFNNDMNNGNMQGMRRIMIPMSFMGNGMGNQNDMNDLIERMLHYSRDNPTDAAIVSELPETQIDDIKKLDKDKQNCVICMEDFKTGDKSTNLPCLHMFHTNCIQNWLKKQNTCPICKFKLTPDNINNINRRA